MSHEYSKAIIPETYTILGLRMKPLCIGHYLLMERFCCNIIKDDTLTSFNDFLLALSICHRSYVEFIDFKDGYTYKHNLGSFLLSNLFNIGKPKKVFDPEYFNTWTRTWGKAVRKAIRKDKDLDLLNHQYTFQKYIKEGFDAPAFRFNEDDGGNGNTGGGHWTHTLLYFLKSEMKMTESEALNYPLQLAFIDYYKHLERHGAGKLFSKEEYTLKQLEEKTHRELKERGM